MGLRSSIRLGDGLKGAHVPGLQSGRTTQAFGGRGIALWRRCISPRVSSRPGKGLRDDTSASSALGGGEASGGDSLSIISGAKEFPEEDDCWGRSRAELKYIDDMLSYNL